MRALSQIPALRWRTLSKEEQALSNHFFSLVDFGHIGLAWADELLCFIADLAMEEGNHISSLDAAHMLSTILTGMAYSELEKLEDPACLKPVLHVMGTTLYPGEFVVPLGAEVSSALLYSMAMMYLSNTVIALTALESAYGLELRKPSSAARKRARNSIEVDHSPKKTKLGKKHFFSECNHQCVEQGEMPTLDGPS